MKCAKVIALLLALTGTSCRRANQVGDHVLVDWRGADYPAVIVGIEGSARFRVHFDGYSNDWDEILPATRIKGRLSTTPNAVIARGLPMKPSVSAEASASAAPSSAVPVPAAVPSMYHVGDRVRVEWHGSIYPASIIELSSDGRYRVHYEGFGNEWDETIGAQRIQRKNN